MVTTYTLSKGPVCAVSAASAAAVIAAVPSAAPRPPNGHLQVTAVKCAAAATRKAAVTTVDHQTPTVPQPGAAIRREEQ
jgi:hypothetical protein